MQDTYIDDAFSTVLCASISFLTKTKMTGAELSLSAGTHLASRVASRIIQDQVKMNKLIPKDDFHQLVAKIGIQGALFAISSASTTLVDSCICDHTSWKKTAVIFASQFGSHVAASLITGGLNQVWNVISERWDAEGEKSYIEKSA